MVRAESNDENFVEWTLFLLVSVRVRFFCVIVHLLWGEWFLEGSKIPLAKEDNFRCYTSVLDVDECR